MFLAQTLRAGQGAEPVPNPQASVPASRASALRGSLSTLPSSFQNRVLLTHCVASDGDGGPFFLPQEP